MLKYLLLNVKSYFVLKLKNLILNFHLQIYFQRLCMNHNQFSITWYPSAATQSSVKACNQIVCKMSVRDRAEAFDEIAAGQDD